MRALVHIGLAAALILAPVLCCCKVVPTRLFGHAASGSVSTTRVPTPSPAQHTSESCCMKVKTTCCHESPAPLSTSAPVPTQHPDSPTAPAPCACCVERPDAAQTETKLSVDAAQPTGELIPPAMIAVVAGCPEHLGLVHGFHSPDPAGVDVRSEILFARHVLRC